MSGPRHEEPVEIGRVDPEVDEVRRSWQLRRRLVRIRRRLRQAFVAALVLLLLGIAFVAQTGQGQDLALRTAVGRAQSSLAGRLAIDGIRSGTLLAGATLTGVRLDAGDGRPFMAADSVVIRYSLPRAVLGGRTIRSTTFWGLEVEISRYTSEQAVNVTRLLTEGDTSEARVGSPSRRLALGHIGIREGRVRVLTPTAEADGVGVVPGPEGEPLREIRFEALDLDVEDAVVRPSAAVAFQSRLASFSSDVYVLSEPLRVDEAFGDVSFGDRGLIVEAGRFRLPGGLYLGDLRLGPGRPDEGWALRSDFETDGWGELSDLHWVDERIPEGRYRGRAQITAADGIDLEAVGVEVQLEASQLLFDGGARFTDGMTLRQMRVQANPVPLERLEPWFERDFPLEGWLTGDATFDGPLSRLDARGHMTLVPTGFGGSPTTADFAGVLLTGDEQGAEQLEAEFDVINYRVLASLWPELPWGGAGRGAVMLDGRLDEGLSIATDLTHVSDAGLGSGGRARGTVWPGSEPESPWIVDLDVELDSFSVGVLSTLAPEAGLRGEVAGGLRLHGSLDALSVDSELRVGGGAVAVGGFVDVTDPTSAYRLDVRADSLPLDVLSDRVPERTWWTGRLELDGRGISPDALEATATTTAERSRFGAVRIDTLAASWRIADGMLTADTLRGRVAGVDLVGGGRLGLVADRYGTARVDFESESLVGLRPLVMGLGDSVMVRDGLTPLDEEFLRLQGVEPDTLPSELDVRMAGNVVGAASLSGSIRDLDVGVLAHVVDGRYRRSQFDTARVAFIASGLPETDGTWQVGFTGRGLQVAGRRYQRGGFEARMSDFGGEGRIELVRRVGESYRARGAFALDSVGGWFDASDATIQVDTRRWRLAEPTRVAWTESSLTVDSLVVVRADEDDPMRLVVAGVLTRGGDSDFHVSLEGLHTERVLQVMQREDLALGGHLDLEATVHGPAEAPVIESSFRIDGPRYGAMQLTRLDGSVQYENRRADFDFDGIDGSRTAVRGSGSVPVDLSFVTVADRTPESPIDVTLVADSLDAAIALSYLTTFEEVLGTVTGEVHVGGTTASPEPTGVIRIADAEWSIEAIGVRHSAVDGELRLRPDRRVEVDLHARGSGSSDVTGEILLEPFQNPQLDLTFEFDHFLAVSRADIEGWVSGSFDLTNRYRRPVAQGRLTVDEGTIYVDELQRAASVVDLSDPFLFEAELVVDTTALVSQPLFAGLSNPFFDNLRVDVDLSVPRGTWLRSIDTNVEMEGELLVRYDRSAGDFVLIGELQAVRGSHRVLGRTFDLQGGTVGFLGRTGLNPDLDIEASTRIRRPEEPPLNVNARVEGTLVQPVVTLTTDEAGLAQEDLISYLIFGQPSGGLGSRRTEALGQLGGGGVVSSAVQGGVTFVGGVLTSQFGWALQRAFSLDYLSVQQAGGLTQLGGEGVGDTQVELGRYLGDEVFVVAVVRVTDSGAQEQNTVAGVRVEWALTDDYNVEGFLEDRFLRTGSGVLGTSNGLLENERIWGVFFFRDWGFSPGRDR